MRLTKAGEYGVRAVHYLSKHAPDGRVVKKKEIASACDIPFHFLGKITPLLSRARIIEQVRGNSGGVRLLKRPEDITLLEVIEAIIGELFLNDCVLNPGSCRLNPGCAVHKVWCEAKTMLRGVLQAKNFQQLTQEEYCAKELQNGCS